jgi:hypothetical protein
VSIRRGPRPETKFYTLDKSISEDARLSWAARGLLIFLLGKPDNWEVSTKHLINQTKEAIGKASGRDAVRVILKELEDAGYLKVDLARSEGGAFNGMSYTVSEVPDFTREPANPAPVEPETENPAPAQPAPVNPHLINNDLQQYPEEAVSNDQSNAPSTCSPPVITMPLNTGMEYPITVAQVMEWSELFPAVDVMQQLRAMRAWLLSNPKKRKTKSGIARFITSWLSRDQDRGGSRSAQQPRHGMSRQEALEARNRQAADDFVYGDNFHG